MTTGAITGYIDVAQLMLYAFWIFFAGLIFYLRQEDRREGYPLESEVFGAGRPNFLLMPEPKTFALQHGGTQSAPRNEAAVPINATKVEPWPGAPYVPNGDPFTANVGPGSYANRVDEPDLTFDAKPRIVPMRADASFTIAAGDPDPRGFAVIGADGTTGGKVVDAWVDRAEMMLRYYELETDGGRRVLVPLNFCRVDAGRGHILVRAILGGQFVGVPGLKNPDTITRLEEEKVMAYYGAGTLYATADRAEPLL